jgi:hypothetical protein
MTDPEKTPANSGAQRKTADVPPSETEQRSGRLPRDGVIAAMVPSRSLPLQGYAGLSGF